MLASASPRRRQLLRAIGIRFSVAPVAIAETLAVGERPAAAAARLALAKAAAARERRPRAAVLAADTLVVVDTNVFGKPANAAQARRMLQCLSGRWHDVLTAVALMLPDGTSRCSVARTRVRFADLTRPEIERYLRSTEPYDKAGAYAIQGIAAWFVAEVRGSVSNVVGLPLVEVRDLFRWAQLPLPALGDPGR